MFYLDITPQIRPTDDADHLADVTCEDIMPQSSKVIVLDSQLSICSAFEALLDNDVEAAPIWDRVEQDYVGMVSMTDFVVFLVELITSTHEANPRASLQDFDAILQNIKNTNLQKAFLERSFKTRHEKTLVGVDPADSLFEAANNLLHDKLNFIPVLYRETRTEELIVLYLLSPKRILAFWVKVLPEWLLNAHIKVDGSTQSTYCDPSTTLQNVLNMAVTNPEFRFDTHLTVPIVDADLGVLLNIFSTKNISKADLHASLAGSLTDSLSSSFSHSQSHTDDKSHKPSLGFLDFARFVFLHKDTPIQDLLELLNLDPFSLDSGEGTESRDSISPPFSPPFKRTYTEGVANLHRKAEIAGLMKNLQPLTNPRPVPGMMGMPSVSSDDWSAESIEGVGPLPDPPTQNRRPPAPPPIMNISNVKPIENPRPVPGMHDSSSQLNSLSTPSHLTSPLSPQSVSPSSHHASLSPPSSPPMVGYPVFGLSTCDSLLHHVVSGSISVKHVIQRMIDHQLQTIVFVKANVVLGILNISQLLHLLLKELTQSHHNEF